MRRPRVLPAIVLACAAAAGCGSGGPDESGPPVTFDACAPLQLVADPGVSDADAAGIASGIALWNNRAATRLTTGAADAGAPSLPIHFQSAAPPFHGFYDAPSGQVFINTDLSGEALAVTIAHEIGHAFGLVHIPANQRPSVMNPNNLVVEPTPEDVDTLAMRWGVCLASPSP